MNREENKPGIAIYVVACPQCGIYEPEPLNDRDATARLEKHQRRHPKDGKNHLDAKKVPVYNIEAYAFQNLLLEGLLLTSQSEKPTQQVDYVRGLNTSFEVKRERFQIESLKIAKNKLPFE